MSETFTELNDLNVNEHTEKKGNFTYLSWVWAHTELAKRDPDFHWEPMMFEHNPIEFPGFRVPYLHSDSGYFVGVVVVFQGKEWRHIYPVLDGRNRPVPEPSSFDINTSIMRCFAKCCALHGLGLYVYAGEDLPQTEVEKQKAERAAEDTGVADKAIEAFAGIGSYEEFVGKWKKLTKPQREAISTHRPDFIEEMKAILEPAK